MTEKQAILLALGNEDIANLIEKSLASFNFELLKAKNLEEVINTLNRKAITAVIFDSSLKEDNFDFIDYLKASNPFCKTIILAKNGTIEEAVDLIKKGAYSYIEYKTPEKTAEKIVSIITSPDFQPEMALELLTQFENLVGKSSVMQDLYKLIEKVAKTDATVLITGESGTGKELVARAIHNRSRRKDKPFIPINCGAIPEELLESELFGHEKGAFSGAIRTKIGRFELANGGTIFLDEIGEMSPKLQVKLLRFLQERKFERIGGLKTIEVDVRVIAATNKDLWKAVQENNFREDLYYRLHVIPIHIPPLRSRKEDIPLLVDHFLKNHCLRKDIELKKVAPEVLECFMNYNWPGNVRELENLIERLIILSDSNEITINELPERFLASRKYSPDKFIFKLPQEGIDLRDFLEKVEKELIKQALERTKGVKNQAAKLLRLNRTTLIEKMKKLNIEL